MKTDNYIFGSDLGSLVESVYLEIPYTDNQRNFNIVVNPLRITYLIGKVVIINKFSYPKENLKILLENEKVILISEKNIDLTDNELNEFLCSYKKVVDDKALNISICENSKQYNY